MYAYKHTGVVVRVPPAQARSSHRRRIYICIHMYVCISIYAYIYVSVHIYKFVHVYTHI